MAKSIRFFEKEIVTLSKLPEDVRGRIFTAVINHCLGLELPELSELESAVFDLVNGQVVRDKEKSERCRKSAEARWHKGASGDDMPDSSTHTGCSCTNTNTSTNTSTNTNTNTDTRNSAEHAPAIHKYGEYKHVRLTDEQYSRLTADFGETKIADYIRRVDEYCQQHGKSYKDYNLTIRNWIRNEREPSREKGLQAAAQAPRVYTDVDPDNPWN